MIIDAARFWDGTGPIKNNAAPSSERLEKLLTALPILEETVEIVPVKGVNDFTVPVLTREEGQELRYPGPALNMNEDVAFLD